MDPNISHLVSVTSGLSSPSILLPSSVLTIVRGVQQVAKFNEQAANEIVVHLACLRLPHHTTDILISLNSPVWVDAQSSSAEATSGTLSEVHTLENVKLLFDNILSSFELRDVGLFG